MIGGFSMASSSFCARARHGATCLERYGPYTTVYKRFNRWAKKGVWLRIFEALAEQSPASLHLIDTSIVRAHQHAAGGKKGAPITPSAVLVED